MARQKAMYVTGRWGNIVGSRRYGKGYWLLKNYKPTFKPTAGCIRTLKPAPGAVIV
jgi:hypothetical protein